MIIHSAKKLRTYSILIITTLIIIGFISCKNGETGFLKEIELKQTGTLSVSTERGLNFFNHSISYFRDDTSAVLSILKSDENLLHFFNANNGRWLKSVDLELEGPNGVGGLGMVSSHLFHSRDSIFIYNVQTGFLSLMDERGKKINTYLVTDYDDDANFPAPFPSTTRPFFFHQGKIYMSCGINNYSDSFDQYPSSLTIDLNSKKINYSSTFPEKYDEAFWGLSFKYDAGIALDQKNKKIVFNYPIDNFLYSRSLDSSQKQEKHFSNSLYFESSTPFDPDSEKYKTINFNEKNAELENHALSDSDFPGILYDDVNHVFYRIAYIRPDINEVKVGNRLPNFSIITLDKNLVKIGEDFFDGKIYDNSMIFVTSKGLNIARKDLYEKNENYLEFEVFSPKEIQSSEVK
jgi:hypothetical protein